MRPVDPILRIRAWAVAHFCLHWRRKAVQMRPRGYTADPTGIQPPLLGRTAERCDTEGRQ